VLIAYKKRKRPRSSPASTSSQFEEAKESGGEQYTVHCFTTITGKRKKESDHQPFFKRRIGVRSRGEKGRGKMAPPPLCAVEREGRKKEGRDLPVYLFEFGEGRHGERRI